ncbi:hypothetical protein B0J14DRAFT_658374 [Halenospora varia]|nr:hypothetical protein B0J14DRAFT_658374 [Halenospora varia]
MWHLAGMPVVERNYALVVNSFGWTSLALVVICLRLFTRAIIVRGLGWDDWFMAGAFINSVGFLVAEMFQIKYGLGQPVNLVTLNPFLAALLATVTLYNIAQALYKLSITTQAYRLFTIYLDKRIMQILISWIITCGIMSVCGSIFYCFPVSKVWNIEADGHCVNRTVLYYCISAFNILSDLMLVMIPLRFLLKLRVAQKQRIVLVCVFGCGAL